MIKQYEGIDEGGLNFIASMECMTYDELVESCNSRWRETYGHDVIVQ